ncbi:MAG: hypothetical protein WD737_12735 [Gemmatimonadota bacterium]
MAAIVSIDKLVLPLDSSGLAPVRVIVPNPLVALPFVLRFLQVRRGLRIG